VVGKKRFRASAGESVFIPRGVPHVWVCLTEKPGKIIDAYKPAGNMEKFFREIGKRSAAGHMHEPSIQELHRLFAAHGMDVVGPPLFGMWKVEKGGRIIQVA
jgi:hypothetical protein